VVYHDGSDPVRMHNYYPLLYNQCVFEVLEEALGAETDLCIDCVRCTAHVARVAK
jgi:alpha-glucosidase (family GH31 glycosyl hydrolase)